MHLKVLVQILEVTEGARYLYSKVRLVKASREMCCHILN